MMLSLFTRQKTAPPQMHREVSTPTWGNTIEESRFGEYSTLPNSVSHEDLEAIAREEAKLKEGVVRLRDYAKHAKGVTESLAEAHEIRADYIQHVFTCVQRFHKANGEVFEAGLKHREKLDKIYDALGIAQAEFQGKQDARNGFNTFRERWMR